MQTRNRCDNQHTELLRAVYDQRLETYIKVPRTLVQDYTASTLFEFLERFIPLYVDFEVWDEDEVGELFPLTYTITRQVKKKKWH